MKKAEKDGKTPEQVRKKEKTAESSEETTERQRLPHSSFVGNQDNHRNSQKIDRPEAEWGAGVEAVATLADCLKAIGHAKRLQIAQYCLTSRTFTEIILNLKLNPASFKFHLGVLTEHGLVEKVERGVYRTTALGKLLLELVNQASLAVVAA